MHLPTGRKFIFPGAARAPRGRTPLLACCGQRFPSLPESPVRFHPEDLASRSGPFPRGSLAWMLFGEVVLSAWERCQRLAGLLGGIHLEKSNNPGVPDADSEPLRAGLCGRWGRQRESKMRLPSSFRCRSFLTHQEQVSMATLGMGLDEVEGSRLCPLPAGGNRDAQLHTPPLLGDPIDRPGLMRKGKEVHS